MRTTKPIREDTFEVFDSYIICHSGSGEDYTITLDSCTCRGFGFHKECRHFKEAKEKGLLTQISTRQVSFNGIKVGSHARLLRKDAIRQYLTKNNISFSEYVIDKIEKVLDVRTRPEEVIKMVSFISKTEVTTEKSNHMMIERHNIEFPDCSSGCPCVEYFGVGECESIPYKFNLKTGEALKPIQALSTHSQMAVKTNFRDIQSVETTL